MRSLSCSKVAEVGFNVVRGQPFRWNVLVEPVHFEGCLDLSKKGLNVHFLGFLGRFCVSDPGTESTKRTLCVNKGRTEVVVRPTLLGGRAEIVESLGSTFVVEFLGCNITHKGEPFSSLFGSVLLEALVGKSVKVFHNVGHNGLLVGLCAVNIRNVEQLRNANMLIGNRESGFQVLSVRLGEAILVVDEIRAVAVDQGTPGKPTSPVFGEVFHSRGVDPLVAFSFLVDPLEQSSLHLCGSSPETTCSVVKNDNPHHPHDLDFFVVAQILGGYSHPNSRFFHQVDSFAADIDLLDPVLGVFLIVLELGH
mmetsp:Transcript_2233/g.3009  ORF Transcript_2233/g.3009 Transcript_2233/m.3009 type:complete len:308 (+) Transcript_2233:689-1612(+)